MSEFGNEDVEQAPAQETAAPAAEPTEPSKKKAEPIDDIAVMSRIKTLMGKLPKPHQERVAKWTADRWL